MTEITQDAAIDENTDIPYVVTWTIDIDASNPREAAEKAQQAQRQWDTTTTVFNVRQADHDLHEAKIVDLSVSAYAEAQAVLIKACSDHMMRLLRNDPLAREKLLSEGFTGFGNMTRVDLVTYAREANLIEGNREVRDAIARIF